MVWVPEVSDCKLGPGAVPGLRGRPAQLVLGMPTKQGLGGFALKRLSHRTQSALREVLLAVPPGPCSGNSPF